MNQSIEFAQKVAANAQELLGDIYTENEIEAFRQQVHSVISEGDIAVEKRIALLFAIWSNINSFGGSIDATPDAADVFMHLRDRKFSIASELSVLCPLVVKRVFGVPLSLSTTEDAEFFKAILAKVDQDCREKRLTDAQSIGLLINLMGAWAQKKSSGSM